MSEENRYQRDWNEYSRDWEKVHGKGYRHLGDEWNDDGTSDRQRDELFFHLFAERFLTKDSVVMEVGCGGGKWTTRLAPRVKKVHVLDVADEMLRRTSERCQKEGIKNVEFIHGNGTDFAPIPDESIDFFFSYDVFVHIALEDTYPYAMEMSRVLKPGGKGTVHHAINSSPDGWDRIEQNNFWYRGGRNTLGQYYYYTPASLRELYQRVGMRVLETHEFWCHHTVTFEKPGDNIVPRLERLLASLMKEESANPEQRKWVVHQLRELHADMGQLLDPYLKQIEEDDDLPRRMGCAQAIRRLWRGE